MPLVNDAIPSLFGGVSQQAPALRNPSQVAAMDNLYPSISEGVGKRPPTSHRYRLETSTPGVDSHIHWINRDATERYMVKITAAGIAVFRKSDGVAMTVNAPSGYGYLSTATVPRNDIACLTIADFTFVVNKKVTTALTAATVGGVVTGVVQRFSDLPAAPPVGVIYQIIGDQTNTYDDYYVVRSAANVWVETRKPGADQYVIDAATMPWALTRTGPTTFTFDMLAWTDRLVGSIASNPPPSFIGDTIKDVLFFRNRLGFVAGEGCVLSQAGSFYDFWFKTMTVDLDSDPIDVTADSTEVVDMLYATTFNSALLLFARNGMQYRLLSGDILSPKTARLVPVTKFESNSDARPLGMGPDLFFAVDRTSYTGVRNYYVDTDTVTNDAPDITDAIPRYIAAGAYRLVGTTTQDTIAVLTTGDRRKVYCYKYLWEEGGNKRLQSAWFTWELDAGATVLGAEFFGTTLSIAVSRAGATPGLFLEELDLQPGLTDCQDVAGKTFLISLDRKVTVTGVYNSGTDITTWTLPYTTSADMQIVLSGSGWGARRGGALSGFGFSGVTLTLAGNWSTDAVTTGVQYLCKTRLSPVYVRDRNGLPRTAGRLQVKRMWLAYTRTSRFAVVVTPKARAPLTYQFTGRILGDSAFILGRVGILDGVYQFPVGGRNEDTIVEIQDDSYLPMYLQSVEWEGEFVLRAARVS